MDVKKFTLSSHMLSSEGAVGDPFLLSNYSQIFTESFIHQTSVNDRVCNMKFRKKNFQAGRVRLLNNSIQ